MSFLDNSSDDDCYINSADQLKALKKKTATNLSELDTVENSTSSQSFDEVSVASESSNSIPEGIRRPSPPRQRPVPRKCKKRSTRNSNKAISDEVVLTTEAYINEIANVPIKNVTAPMNITDEISLIDSDSDDVIAEQVSDVDEDDDVDKNYEISVKINWRSTKLERLPLRKYQPFSEVFEYFSAMEKIPVERIWLMLRNEKQVQPSDTPNSLGLTIVDILEGGIVDAIAEHKTAISKTDKDSINIKVQMKDQKQTLNMLVKKTQKIKVLISMCAEQLQIPEEKIKFHFDGEPVNPNETPDSLDLEDGECFDMHTLP